jgi:hypothetical protein
MKNIGLAICAAVALCGGAAAQSAIPHLEKRGAATQLIVDGRPYLMLAGELTNSASSDLKYLAPYWPKLAAAHINTVLAAVSWELVEPEPGQFDFSLVDGMIRDARQHNLRLIFLWFGSWKNGVSSYTPLWVKRNPRQYPLFLAENGVTLSYLSVFHEANWKADAKAYAALMRHIREVDGEAHTVIMMQVENEVGCPGGTYDHNEAGKAAFAAPVPKALMDYMAKNKEALVPEFRKQWEAAGARTSGTWEEVFGKDPMTNEIFMAWHYARYLDQVTKAGKAEYPLPTFVNAALGEKIGQYSGGGPLPIVLNVWQQGAPSVDVISPDIYLPNFAEWCARYNRAGNPLWIPETRADAANAFYAIGKHAALGVSPFGIERNADPGTPYAKAYDALAQAAPLILEAQGKGTIGVVTLNTENPAQSLKLGNYSLDFRMGRTPRAPAPQPTGAGAPTAGGQLRPAAGAAQPTAPAGFGGAAQQQAGYAIAIQTGPDDYVIVGNMVQCTFSINSPGPSTVAIGALEEGVYVDGRWAAGRRLNGDDIMLNYDAQNKATKDQSGQGLRLSGDGPKIVRVKLYRY